MLNVCTSATSTDGALSTTTALRLMLGTTSTADDATQAQAIVDASAWAHDFIGLPIGQLEVNVYSENCAAYGGSTLMLSRVPILAVTRVLYGSTSTGTATSYSSTDYRLDKRIGLLYREQGFPWTQQMPYMLGPYAPPQGELETWYVEYTAGYVGVNGTSATCAGTTSTGRTLPSSIERAVLLKAMELYTNTPGLINQKIGDLSVTYASGEAAGRAAERLLEPHRVTRV